MTEATADGAVSGLPDWHSINWNEVHKETRRLQMRIAKATREGRWGKVKALQWLLTHSFYGKALAVKRVTENQGKRTPGVDGETWNTPVDKSNAMRLLKRRGYQPQSLKRVLIPKANGKKRPLGIPTMKDRAMQALHLLALEAVAETTADPNSYGFRPHRASRDAIGQCFTALATKRAPQWVLDADISGCFDNISHQWVLKNIPMDKSILRKWLKSGFVWKGRWFPTMAGTPQGGIISPTLANMVLDGLERELEQQCGVRYQPNGLRRNPQKINLIRYADDFIITGASGEALEKAKSVAKDFLNERGLTLSVEKTSIRHIEGGFDFLGWNCRKYKGKLIIKPAKTNVSAFLKKIKETIGANKQARQENLIGLLNPMIRGWANYHKHQVAKETFSKVDRTIWEWLWKWSKRRHPNKSKKWIKDRYYLRQGNRNWIFGTRTTGKDEKEKVMKLVCASNTPIRRHIKIKGTANPYHPECEHYFEERWQRSMKEELRSKRMLSLWIAQQGRCATCGEKISKETGWNLHHIQPRCEGGKDTLTNLALLHPNCHRQLHNLVNKGLPVPITRGLEEARAV